MEYHYLSYPIQLYHLVTARSGAHHTTAARLIAAELTAQLSIAAKHNHSQNPNKCTKLLSLIFWISKSALKF